MWRGAHPSGSLAAGGLLKGPSHRRLPARASSCLGALRGQPRLDQGLWPGAWTLGSGPTRRCGHPSGARVPPAPEAPEAGAIPAWQRAGTRHDHGFLVCFVLGKNSPEWANQDTPGPRRPTCACTCRAPGPGPRRLRVGRGSRQVTPGPGGGLAPRRPGSAARWLVLGRAYGRAGGADPHRAWWCRTMPGASRSRRPLQAALSGRPTHLHPGAPCQPGAERWAGPRGSDLPPPHVGALCTVRDSPGHSGCLPGGCVHA